jgi:GAF domain-containing protein
VRDDLRAAAGAPVLAHDGRRIGTVAVIDHRPRTFDDGELTALVDVAGLVAHEIELRTAVRRAAFDA